LKGINNYQEITRITSLGKKYNCVLGSGGGSEFGSSVRRKFFYLKLIFLV